jgi:hypothetical protein
MDYCNCMFEILLVVTLADAKLTVRGLKHGDSANREIEFANFQVWELNITADCIELNFLKLYNY